MDSVLQPPVKGLGDLRPVEIARGDSVAMEEVVRGLPDAAYTRVDMVQKRGEFAVRGGLVDVFPPTERHPQLLELTGKMAAGIAVEGMQSLAPALVDEVEVGRCFADEDPVEGPSGGEEVVHVADGRSP